ncbi:MAG TPA: prolyl oligopeptidase family serine peptidase [Gemmatimonadales bacterium]|nr:prolyl oligopeptidase family serine peptidase [Gemmatimonadales bacterium]
MTDPASMPSYPPTPTSDAVEVLHGETIPDPYRWLEDGESPATRAWTEAQNALTRSYLDAVPARARIRSRLEQLLAIGAISVPTPVRGRYFYQRRDDRQNQPVLYLREGVRGEDRPVVDPNALDAGGTIALDWYYPSDDGRLLAYGLSENGSEQSVLRVLDVDAGADLPDRIPHTRAADLAWLPDGTGFYYTRYPAPGEAPEGEEHYHRAIRFHRLGTDPAADPLIFKPAEKEHWPSVGISPDGRWLVIGVARTFDQTDLYLQDLRSGTPPVAVAKDLPASFEGEVAHGRLFLRTNLDAPTYRLYTVDPEHPERERWREIIPPRQEAVLEGVRVTARHLALSYLERASSRLRLTDHEGRRLREVTLPTLGSLFGAGAEWDGDELFYGFSSYTVPPRVYRVELDAGAEELWRGVEADVDPDRYEVRQVCFRSKDGTEVTMFLVQRAGLVRDGTNPVYLTGYGGFNISMTPSFSRSLLLWLECGGVVAIPNIRGGGEYGERWHQEGMLDRKQNSFDDFIAAAEWLIAEGYTTPARLAAAGGSNGGLLMGAVLTQRPELFRAVVVQVPLLDMLRYHRFLIARLWIPEYGSAEEPAQFSWLRAYSPYHRVREGVPYPAVLLATAESDTRVDPMHARKMAARLQAATSSSRPILLRLESRAGHGAGKPLSKVLEELTDTWAFVFSELGVEYKGE